MSLRIPPIIHGIETVLLVYLDDCTKPITYYDELVDALPSKSVAVERPLSELRESGGAAPAVCA